MKKEIKLTGYRNLLAHQKADELAFKIYDITRIYPKDEERGIVSQMRRAAISVPANIAEGYTRSSKAEKVRFLNIAQGSLVELEYFIDFSSRLGYINNKNLDILRGLKDDSGKLLYGLIKSYKNDLRSQIADR